MSIALGHVPSRIASLPRDARGYPIPWFVEWFDGKPDFRVLKPCAAETAMARNICWICGQPLGVHRALVMGPLCALQRITSEPACHRECAEFAVQACPFMANPRMERSPRSMPLDSETLTKDYALENPGVFAIWMTRDIQFIKRGSGQRINNDFIIKFGEPERVMWYCEKRDAMLHEVLSALNASRVRLIGRYPADRITKMVESVFPYLPGESP